MAYGNRGNRINPQLQNLAPQMKKGETLNPHGRKKGSRNRSTIAKMVLNMVGVVPEQIFEKLKELYPGIERNMTLEEIGAFVQARKMVHGNLNSYLALVDGAYGKTAQTINHTGNVGNESDLSNYSEEELIERLSQLERDGATDVEFTDLTE